MKDSKERRAKAVEKYKRAYEAFTAEGNNKTWRQCLEDAGCDKKYPFMNLAEFSTRTDTDLAISDLIGLCGRLGWQSGNAPFIEAFTEVTVETRIKPLNPAALTNEELCKEFYNRRLHERYTEDGEPAFYQDVQVDVEFDPAF